MKKIRVKQAQKNKWGIKTAFIWEELEDKYDIFENRALEIA